MCYRFQADGYQSSKNLKSQPILIRRSYWSSTLTRLNGGESWMEAACRRSYCYGKSESDRTGSRYSWGFFFKHDLDGSVQHIVKTFQNNLSFIADILRRNIKNSGDEFVALRFQFQTQVWGKFIFCLQNGCFCVEIVENWQFYGMDHFSHHTAEWWHDLLWRGLLKMPSWW